MHYPIVAQDSQRRVEFVDIGCGYGGLLGALDMQQRKENWVVLLSTERERERRGEREREKGREREGDR